MIEIKRQMIHLGIGIFFLLVAVNVSSQMFLAVALSFFILSLILFRGLREKKIISIMIKEVERPQEKKFKGKAIIIFFFGFLIFGALSFLLDLSLVEKIIVLIPFAFSDSFSAVVGHYFGKHKITKNKTIEGFTAFFLSTFILLYITQSFWFGFLLTYSIIASLIELLPFDDNLSLPLVMPLVLVALKSVF